MGKKCRNQWKLHSEKNGLKAGLSPSKKMCVICFIESLLKIIKNAFCFILKALFVLKIFNCLSWLWSCRKSGLIRNISLISKFVTSQPGKQTIAIHIFPNISRSKSNQTMKLGQLIDYNKRKIFLQKLCRKWGRESSYRPLKLVSPPYFVYNFFKNNVSHVIFY